jgi:hypothetical protein
MPIAWIPLTESKPEVNQIVLCYRESPKDAEAMLFNGEVFIDLFEKVWTNVTHWKRRP